MIEPNVFKAALAFILDVAPVEDPRPGLTNVLIESLGDRLRLVSLDGSRMAVVELKLNQRIEPAQVVVTRKDLARVAHLMADETRYPALFLLDSALVEINGRVIHAADDPFFPNWERAGQGGVPYEPIERLGLHLELANGVAEHFEAILGSSKVVIRFRGERRVIEINSSLPNHSVPRCTFYVMPTSL